MAATVVPKSTSVSIKLNMGTSAAGKTIVKGVSLGKIRTNADVNGILEVAETLVPCLDKPALRVERVVTDIIEDGD